MRTLRALSLLVVLSLPVASGAQMTSADTSARRAAMAKLAFMVGEWSGDASIQVGRGKTLVLRQSERVRMAVGGQVMVVEGVGRQLADGTPGDTVFHAFATIDWLPERGYLMRSSTLDGRQGTMSITLPTTGTGFDWGFTTPGGQVRYQMRLTPDGKWHEVGEFSRDGAQWFPTFEMTVARVSPR